MKKKEMKIQSIQANPYDARSWDTEVTEHIRKRLGNGLMLKILTLRKLQNIYPRDWVMVLC